jgi:cytochrome P450
MRSKDERGDPASFPVPPHVDPGHVKLFDFDNDAEYARDPHTRLSALREERRLFFTPKGRKALLGGGTWVFTHAADIRAVLQDADTFRSGGNRPFAKALGENWVLIPIDLDAPEHNRMRGFMNPLFSPKRVAAMAPEIELRARDLIVPIQGRSECAFIEAFARPFPVSIFLELLGLPIGDMARFVEWVELIIHSQGASQLEGMRQLRDYLRDVIDARRRDPKDDLISHAVTGTIDGAPLTYDEIMGMCVMLFMGGLDTVTSELSFLFRHLADNPDQQAMLRANPEAIPTAVEELLRIYPIITTSRITSRDVEIDGAVIRKGENIACPMASAARDPAEVENADVVDLARSPNRHAAFGFGPHRCIGSHLARRELIVAIEQWLAMLPPFRIKPGAEITAQGAGVVTLTSLPLIFD